MLNDDALNIRYFSYHSYVRILTSKHTMEINRAGMKTCETLHFGVCNIHTCAITMDRYRVRKYARAGGVILPPTERET